VADLYDNITHPEYHTNGYHDKYLSKIWTSVLTENVQRYFNITITNVICPYISLRISVQYASYCYG
jgi:hypothetical protein